jgi:transposase InsO family protein
MTQQEIIVKNRRSLLIFAQRHGVTKACRIFQVSRTTFYKIKKQFTQSGSLEPIKRRKSQQPNETSTVRKKALLKLIKEQPGLSLDRYVEAFKNQGIRYTRESIYNTLKRFHLNTRYLRLLYVETLKKEQQPITERTLTKLRHRFYKIKKAYWPGHIVALDTFFVGHLKGVGRIYQMTGIDLYSRYGWAELYSDKTAISSSHFLEHVLIPKFFQNNVRIDAVLTDNGTEFTANKFTQILKDYGLRHHRIPKGKPMFNGKCERFQRTILNEFYQTIFRQKFFSSMEELSIELQKYLVHYNFNRLHFGLAPTGLKPIDAFKNVRSMLRLNLN